MGRVHERFASFCIESLSDDAFSSDKPLYVSGYWRRCHFYYKVFRSFHASWHINSKELLLRNIRAFNLTCFAKPPGASKASKPSHWNSSTTQLLPKLGSGFLMCFTQFQLASEGRAREREIEAELCWWKEGRKRKGSENGTPLRRWLRTFFDLLSWSRHFELANDSFSRIIELR